MLLFVIGKLGFCAMSFNSKLFSSLGLNHLPPFGYCLAQSSCLEYFSGGWIHNNVPYLELQYLYIGRCIHIIVADLYRSLPNCLTLMWHLQIGHKTNASSPASLQYFVPYTGATTAKYFMHCKQHTLIIYDGLSKKAQSYR